MSNTAYFDTTGWHREPDGTYWIATPGYQQAPSGPHTHRKRISRRRARVAQRNMDNTDFLRYHDIVPERTYEDFQKGYHARMDRVKDYLHEYVDIDLPLVEDNW